ncbi:MAG: hypothetical protein J7605_02615 [Variovorax sp.]|nr:hypothetical protein [Variovorax sp.]
MSRLQWVDARLQNWARWRSQMAGNGLGFASQASFLNDQPGSDREVRIPVDEIEASVTQEAVESLKVARPHIYAVLYCMYPFGLGVTGTCRRLECARSNVYALLEVGDRLLATWFTERSAKQTAAKEEMKRDYEVAARRMRL